MIYGGDRLKDADVAIRTAHTTSLANYKILLQDVLSTPDGKFIKCDLKDFFLQVRLPKFEWISIPIAKIPQSTVKKYNLQSIQRNGKVLFEVTGGMYGLPQANRLSQEALKPLLAQHGYLECPNTPAMYRHATNSVKFTLTVNDFGVRYVDPADAQHLLDCLQLQYKLKTDWTGKIHLGIMHD